MAMAFFLVVEFPVVGQALIDFTRRNEGVTIDSISEPGADVPGDRIHPTTILVKGATPDQLRELAADIEREYGPPRTLERDDLRGIWMARIMSKESKMRDKGLAALSQFQHRFGVPWAHAEGGVMHLRVRVPDPATGESLVHQVRGFLHATGVDAQVSLLTLDTADYSVWTDLVEHSLGLAP